MSDPCQESWLALAGELDDLRAAQDVPSVVVGCYSAGRSKFASAGRLASGQRPSPDTQYRIGSVTKTFTAAAVIELARIGRLGVDDALCTWIPELAAATGGVGDPAQVTVRHVLTHRSGLPGEAALPYWRHERFPHPQRLLTSLSRSTLFAVPGTEVKYSNLGYALLGVLISRAGSRHYRGYIDRMVRARRLAATGWRPVAPAAGHDRGVVSGVVPASFPHMAAMSPSGSLWSTCTDQLRWLVQHASDVQAEPGPLNERLTGLGWFSTPDDAALHTHGGAVPGYQSFAAVDVDSDTAVVVLTDLLGHTLGEEICARLLGRPSPLPDGPPAVAPKADRTLSGVYHWHGLRAHVQQQNDLLALSFPVLPRVSAPPVLCRPGRRAGQFTALSGRFAGEDVTFDREGFTVPGGARFAKL